MISPHKQLESCRPNCYSLKIWPFSEEMGGHQRTVQETTKAVLKWGVGLRAMTASSPQASPTFTAAAAAAEAAGQAEPGGALAARGRACDKVAERQTTRRQFLRRSNRRIPERGRNKNARIYFTRAATLSLRSRL
ncbi:hypothetical protein ACJJTC_008380 [Scirpophaga incertulas]